MAAHTDNEIVIQAPLALVWEVANDIPSWPVLFVDEYAAAEVLERVADRVLFRLTTVPGPDGNSHSWVSERVADPAMHRVSSRRVETGPFRYMHIFQCFQPDGDGTLLRWVQDFEVRPSAPFSEEWMRARIDAGSKVQLRHHQRHIEALHGRADRLVPASGGRAGRVQETV